MIPNQIIDVNDPQSLAKFCALAQGADDFSVTNIDRLKDYTSWAVRAKDRGWEIVLVKADPESFYFTRTKS